MNKYVLSSIIRRIVETDMVNDTSIKFERTGTYHQLKDQIKNIFVDALKGIKPLNVYVADVYEITENSAPWTCYNNFNYRRYFKAADNKFYLLKKRLAKQHINLLLEYNMAFHQMWMDFQIDLNNNGKEEDCLIFWSSDLRLDNFFHKEILDEIFVRLNIYPFMMELCIPQIANESEKEIEMKAWNINWDT